MKKVLSIASFAVAFERKKIMTIKQWEENSSLFMEILSKYLEIEENKRVLNFLAEGLAKFVIQIGAESFSETDLDKIQGNSGDFQKINVIVELMKDEEIRYTIKELSLHYEGKGNELWPVSAPVYIRNFDGSEVCLAFYGSEFLKKKDF